MTRRNVYLAFDHREDRDVAEDLKRSFREQCQFFEDRSQNRVDDDSTSGHLTEDCIKAIEKSSGLVVIIGKASATDPFIDWEVRQSLLREHGLVAVRVGGTQHTVPARVQDNVNNGFALLTRYPSTARDVETLIRWMTEAERDAISNDRTPMDGRGPRS